MSAAPRIRLINPMWNAAGGSEWRTRELFHLLGGGARVSVHADGSVAATFARELPIEPLDASAAAEMHGDTVIIVGTYFPLGDWLEALHPGRLIVIHNVFDPRLLRRTLARINAAEKGPAELVYTSRLVALAAGLSGIIHHSPIDLERFVPDRARPDRPWTIGRLSRDVAQKHHPEDPALYQSLLDAGIAVRLMGATVIGEALAPQPRLAVLPAGAVDALEFLRSLDAFIFRTDPCWLEPFGRVVVEALACGLPVVACRSGGHCEYLEHEHNALLFSTTTEAQAQLLRLRDDAGLRERLGNAGRRSVETLYGQRVLQGWVDFYTRGGRASRHPIQ